MSIFDGIEKVSSKGPPMTDKQRDYIMQLAGDPLLNPWDYPELASREALQRLTVGEASALIDRMLEDRSDVFDDEDTPYWHDLLGD